MGVRVGIILRICLMLAIILTAVANGAASNSDLPLSESFQLREVSAQEVMASANNSLVVYDRAVINGDLYLTVDQNTPIKVTNSIFRGNVSCKGITFYGDVDFENTTFQGNAIFNETKFMTAANFNATHFLREASFNMSRFLDGGMFDFADFSSLADFDSVWFDKFATFYNATFMGNAQFAFSEFNGAYANFEIAHFFGDLYFYGSQVNSYCTFADARLEKDADFHATKYSNGAGFLRTQFIGPANFARSHFIEDSIFSKTQFNDTATFLNAKFDGPVFFNDTVFCKNADFTRSNFEDSVFSKTQFNDTASFLNVKFDGPAFFNDTVFYRDVDFDNAQFQAPTDMSNAAFKGDLKMNSTKIARMVLDGSTFLPDSRLYLAKADINRMIVSWSDIRDILSFDTAAYLALIKNYKDLGQSNDANECYYEYRYLNQARKPVGFSKFLDTVAWLTCGYGVRPHYALFCGMVIILIFSIIYWAGRGVEGFHNIHGHQLIVASLFYSTIAFTANSKGLPLRGRYKYLGIAEGIVGWLLMALFLVTLGRLIIG